MMLPVFSAPADRWPITTPSANSWTADANASEAEAELPSIRTTSGRWTRNRWPSVACS